MERKEGEDYSSIIIPSLSVHTIKVDSRMEYSPDSCYVSASAIMARMIEGSSLCFTGSKPDYTGTCYLSPQFFPHSSDHNALSS